MKNKKVPNLRFPEFSGAWQFLELKKYIVPYVERVLANTNFPILTEKQLNGTKTFKQGLLQKMFV